jgi:hypothetical protein
VRACVRMAGRPAGCIRVLSAGQASTASFCVRLKQGTYATGRDYVDGWWRGENHAGHLGCFPGNYVEPVLRNVRSDHDDDGHDDEGEDDDGSYGASGSELLFR